MKNNQFNFNRFGRYFVADLNNCIANYGLSLLIVSLMGLIVTIFVLLISSLIAVPFDEMNTLPKGGSGYRVSVFLLSALVLVTTMPSKCYGGLTDKRIGSSFLLLPVSRLEKFLSMLINMLVVMPAAFLVISLGVDALYCLINPASVPIVRLSHTMFESLRQVQSDIQITDLSSMSAWIFLDDLWGNILIFILGAICFKNGKVSKTIGLYILVCMVFSLLGVAILGDIDVEEMMKQADTTRLDWLVRMLEHPVLWDTVYDTLLNLLLCAGIFWRVKTLKH